MKKEQSSCDFCGNALHQCVCVSVARPSVAASGSVVCKVRDTICHGCVIRPLPDMGAGPRYRVTLIRTGEAREVRMPSLYDCLSNLTVENRLITVMNALEWSDPLNDQVSNPHPDKTP